MKIKGIRISDKKNNIVSVELPNILAEILDGNSCYWSILHLYATGCLNEGQSIPGLESKIRLSEKGLLVTWEELNNLAQKFWDLMDITIIGCIDRSLIRRYENSQRMYKSCDIVIEMIDSSYWEVFSKDSTLIDRLEKTFKDTKLLDPNCM